MENATHALLIAGGVLLAILIIAIGMNIFITYSGSAESMSEKWNMAEISSYNSDFISYMDRNDVTAQEIVSLVNLSKQRNSEIAIFVKTTTGTLKGNNNLVEVTNKQLTQFLNDHILTTTRSNPGAGSRKNTFSYVNDSIKYDEKTGKVISISFTEN